MTGQTQRVFIEHLENIVYAYLTTTQYLRPEIKDSASLIAQDLGPVLADHLGDRGVDVDWFDGSRAEHRKFAPDYRSMPLGYQPPTLYEPGEPQCICEAAKRVIPESGCITVLCGIHGEVKP